MSRLAVLTTLFISAVLLTAQSGDRRNKSSVDPCPGGTATAEVDVVSVPTLEGMIRGSKLIVDGTVVRVLPAFSNDPEHLGTSIETDSLIAVTEVVSGTLPAGISTIGL